MDGKKENVGDYWPIPYSFARRVEQSRLELLNGGPLNHVALLDAHQVPVVALAREVVHLKGRRRNLERSLVQCLI